MHLIAPKNLSLLNNPEEFVDFIEHMRKAFAKKRSVEINLSDTTAMTADAITALVAHLKDDRFTRGRPYRGNEPSDENLKQQFTESGFYNYVVSSQRPKNPNYGSIRARHKVKVDGERAAELIHFGTEKLFGEIKRCPGVYNALVESMNNTRDHAAASKKHRER